jgi:hypothetical protein
VDYLWKQIIPARNNIDYITIATTGNALKFGDLLGVEQYFFWNIKSIRGIFAGGYLQHHLS